MYRAPPKRKPKTVAKLRAEAAAQARQDREKKKVEAEEKRRTENMAGSSKKKRNPSKPEASKEDQATGSSGSSASDGIDPGMKSFLLSIKNEIMESNKEAIRAMDKKVEENRQDIERMRVEFNSKVDRMESTLNEKLETEMAKLKAAPIANARTGTAVSTMGKKEEAFNLSRKSLKIWPVDGTNLTHSVHSFLRERLGFDQEIVAAMGAIAVRRALGKAAELKKEVIARFESKEDRDMVKGAGNKLAGKTDAGMAIHVPGHMLDSLHALNAIAYQIKSKHEGVRRSVKFDDINQDIYMDILIGGNWRRISSSQAKLAVKNLPEQGASKRDLTADDLTSLVKGNDISEIQATVVTDGEDSEHRSDL